MLRCNPGEAVACLGVPDRACYVVSWGKAEPLFRRPLREILLGSWGLERSLLDGPHVYPLIVVRAGSCFVCSR